MTLQKTTSSMKYDRETNEIVEALTTIALFILIFIIL
jgi:hypothetical protein